ncbi:AAA family ATPase [Pseudohaliea rubra]|uniref:MoxR-like ATPase in aerotolerance operon n=1 Tax=Pseudohaliea rubra DSM 19751 TaxID=1265313 RepID=A0A095VSB5_9GAMM|nr:MoxR family ATPase [Pseudohaliea rubra]KGE04255.1 MoxR-like ATPase in aerotolerance operon [Pseudohaliea rubra DSM 19751]
MDAAVFDAIQGLRARVGRSVLGQEALVERLVISLLANGNCLLEGLPGLAKTRAVKALARALAVDFSRLQFTPDLLPADVTGTEILHAGEGATGFRFDPGPVFANIVLVDEVNRAPAKVQSALLEVMEERQVTVAGTTHSLPRLFMVLATQNPIEQEGTYPLPEAQLDRFLMHLYVDYPDRKAEVAILRLVRGEEDRTVAEAGDADPPVDPAVVFAARREIAAVTVSELVERYIVDLVAGTRAPGALDAELARWLHVGASPRGGLALDRCARVRAWLDRRDHVLPEDVRASAHDCLRHRLILSYDAEAEGVSADAIIDRLLATVAVG